MLNKGCYRVVQILDISHSLNSQQEKEPENSDSSIKKCILVNDSNQLVAYFIDLPEIGQESEIILLKDLEVPLIQKKDIRIVKMKNYSHNYEFIKKLSEKP